MRVTIKVLLIGILPIYFISVCPNKMSVQYSYECYLKFFEQAQKYWKPLTHAIRAKIKCG